MKLYRIKTFLKTFSGTSKVTEYLVASNLQEIEAAHPNAYKIEVLDSDITIFNPKES